MDKEALVYRRTIADLSASIKHFQHDFHDLAKHIQVKNFDSNQKSSPQVE